MLKISVTSGSDTNVFTLTEKKALTYLTKMKKERIRLFKLNQKLLPLAIQIETIN